MVCNVWKRLARLALGGAATQLVCLRMPGDLELTVVRAQLPGLAGKSEGGLLYLPKHPSWLRLSNANLKWLV